MKSRKRSLGVLWTLLNFSHIQQLSIASALLTYSSDIKGSVLSVDDGKRLKQTISAGRVFQKHHFLTEKQVIALLDDIQQLEDTGAFEPSGLSNTVKGKNQDFDQKRDRTTCPLPWWKQSLVRNIDDRITPQFLQTEIGQSVSNRIQKLRLEVSNILNRPTMSDAQLAHECYYSQSKPGSSLPRHLDERHEEMKGARGWLLPSRRSISWLIYLSNEDPWDIESYGGALRSYPQPQVSMQCGSHSGNLQVGWLLDSTNDSPISQPVFLDSWYKNENSKPKEVEPQCILYVFDSSKEKSIIYLTHPFLIESIQGTLPEFMALRKRIEANVTCDATTGAQDRLFKSSDIAARFALIEDRALWEDGEIPSGSVKEDFAPERGSLVMFDSVALPHEVLIMKEGRRVALAGWFHEETQPFPVNFYSA